MRVSEPAEIQEGEKAMVKEEYIRKSDAVKICNKVINGDHIPTVGETKRQIKELEPIKIVCLDIDEQTEMDADTKQLLNDLIEYVVRKCGVELNEEPSERPIYAFAVPWRYVPGDYVS